MLQELYNWPTPYYKVKNKTKSRPSTQEIDEKTLAAINHYNNADNQLYAVINKKISEKIESKNFMSLKLARLAVFNSIYSNKFSRKIASTIKSTLT